MVDEVNVFYTTILNLTRQQAKEHVLFSPIERSISLYQHGPKTILFSNLATIGTVIGF